MIKGMSGFGQFQSENKRYRVTVQVRTVNHRYLDYSIYLPESLRSLEAHIKSKVKKKIKRGKVTASFNIIKEDMLVPRIDYRLALFYSRLAKELNRKLGISPDISFAQLLSLPSVIQQRREIVGSEAMWHLILASLGKAIEAVVKMRKKEGIAIYKDLKDRAGIIKEKIRSIEKEFPKIIGRAKKRLSGEELNSFKKSIDVSEETVRLKFHLANLCRTAIEANTEPAGKELDFISQELQREINTLGAKVPDKNVSYTVVKIKSQLEKIREQLQNVE